MAPRKKTEEKTSPFHKGRVKRRKGGSGNRFVGVKPDESITIVPLIGLDEILSADMHEYWDIKPAIFHPCLNRDCPGCAVENEARFKGYMPVIVRGEEKEARIFPFTISVYNGLELLEDALDDDESIKGMAIKISRTGSGLSTRYNVVGTGKMVNIDGVDIPDIESTLGPTTVDSIWELLEANGYDRDDPSTAPAKSSDDDDDDDWDSV